ncbi:hypothetical protein SAMN05421783_1091, partial [Thiocapsa roseopersicina]
MSHSRPCVFALPWLWLPIAIAIAPMLAAQEPDTAAAPADEPDDPILSQALTPW